MRALRLAIIKNMKRTEYINKRDRQFLPLIATDYHTHSTFSPDARDSISAMCAEAYHQGLRAIAITDHAEWHPKWYTQPNWPRYFAGINEARINFAETPFQILTGVELGNPHDYLSEVRPFLDRHQFDVIALSVHWLYGENIHDAVCFRGRNPQAVYRDYFRAMRKMVEQVPGTFVAHFDRIFWRGARLGVPFQAAAIRPQVESAFAAIIERGVGLELNTKYLADRPDWLEALVTLLNWYREMGGDRVLVNSDAHATHHLLQNQELALSVLYAAGLREPWRMPTAVAGPEPIV
jgi:histidinol-phosphatase (PHP family)